MYLAHLTNTAFPWISLKLWPKTPSHLRSQDFGSKVCFQVVAVRYTLAPFRVAGAVTVPRLRRYRWEQQKDGCRGTRAALRWVEYPSQRWRAAAYGGAVAFRSFTGPLVLSSGYWLHGGFHLFWSVRRPDANDGQPLTTATTHIWCCTPPGMLV